MRLVNNYYDLKINKLTSRTKFCASKITGLLDVVGGHNCCTLLCTDNTRTNSGFNKRHWITATSGSALLLTYMPFFFNCKCIL